MRNVGIWSGLWVRIRPMQMLCMFLESPKPKVETSFGCSRLTPDIIWITDIICLDCLGKNNQHVARVHHLPQKCKPKCSTLTSSCPYTNTSARPRNVGRLRTSWRVWGCLTRRGMEQSWVLSSGMFWQHWVSWTRYSGFCGSFIVNVLFFIMERLHFYCPHGHRWEDEGGWGGAANAKPGGCQWLHKLWVVCKIHHVILKRYTSPSALLSVLFCINLRYEINLSVEWVFSSLARKPRHRIVDLRRPLHFCKFHRLHFSFLMCLRWINNSSMFQLVFVQSAHTLHLINVHNVDHGE